MRFFFGIKNWIIYHSRRLLAKLFRVGKIISAEDCEDHGLFGIWKDYDAVIDVEKYIDVIRNRTRL